MKTFHIYTDGSSMLIRHRKYKTLVPGYESKRLNISGASFYIQGEQESPISKAFISHNTGTTAEIYAVVMALRHIKQKANITIYSDNSTVVQNIESFAGQNTHRLAQALEADDFKAYNAPYNVYKMLDEAMSKHNVSAVRVPRRCNKLARLVDNDARKTAKVALGKFDRPELKEFTVTNGQKTKLRFIDKTIRCGDIIPMRMVDQIQAEKSIKPKAVTKFAKSESISKAIALHNMTLREIIKQRLIYKNFNNKMLFKRLDELHPRILEAKRLVAEGNRNIPKIHTYRTARQEFLKPSSHQQKRE